MLRRFASIGGAALLLILAPRGSAAEVQVTMHDGRVSLVATDATIREILERWAEVGQATIVNAERLTGGPVTMQLSNVPEAEALAVILRSASGFIAAPRQTAAPNLSLFDRIHVLPTSSAPRSAPSTTPAFPQPQFNPLFNQQGEPVDSAPDPGSPVPIDPSTGLPAGPVPRGPVFGSFPPPIQAQPETPDPARTAQPSYAPNGVPAGVAVPGMIVPVPDAQSGAPNAPGTPPGRTPR